MLNKIAPLLFLVAFVLPSACVTVNVDDDNSSSSGNNTCSTGSSGVSSAKKATDFSAQETADFCTWLVDLYAPHVGEEKDCGGDVTVTYEPFSRAECDAALAQNPGCPVSQLEDCFELLVTDACLLVSETPPAACAGLEQCASDTGTNNTSSNNVSVNNSSSTFCYDHNCNGDATGEQCFSTQEDYCDALCLETNCISVEACEAECF
jgi:hypothetical protein